MKKFESSVISLGNTTIMTLTALTQWFESSVISLGNTTLEYPQFLTPETRHVPDSIGRDAFSKVK